MFNTIILVIIAVICGVYVMLTIDGIENNDFNFSHLLVVILCLAIIVQAKCYDNPNSHKYAEAYNNGYDDAIESAELVEVTDDGYFIKFGTFGTSVHEYTYDD